MSRLGKYVDVRTADLYYICQIVDTATRQPEVHLRRLEEIFGDMNSMHLSASFPQYTTLHAFINAIIFDVIDEDFSEGNGSWVDILFSANSLKMSFQVSGMDHLQNYYEFLSEEGWFTSVAEIIVPQVFHVLFSNRGTLYQFSKMASNWVWAAEHFTPGAFSHHGRLRRAEPPMWAKNAVFHRDKGRCVYCRTDLSRVISNESLAHYDHVIPLSKQGINCVTNLQTLCSHCNLKKSSDIYPAATEYEPWYRV